MSQEVGMLGSQEARRRTKEQGERKKVKTK